MVLQPVVLALGKASSLAFFKRRTHTASSVRIEPEQLDRLKLAANGKPILPKMLDSTYPGVEDGFHFRPYNVQRNAQAAGLVGRHPAKSVECGPRDTCLRLASQFC